MPTTVHPPGSSPQMADIHTVAIIGLGYVGMPTAAIIASRGFQVTGVDINHDTVDAVNAGRSPLYEPGLDQLIQLSTQREHLRASIQTPSAHVYIIAVPTPIRDDCKADLSFVETAADAIAPQMRQGALVILESTSPPGTTAYIAQLLARLRPDLRYRPNGPDNQFHVVYCPERILPGRGLHELRTNDRVIGSLEPEYRDAERAASFYRSFCDGHIITTSAATAEMVKLAENAYRDVNIAFANELEHVSNQLGIDARDLIRLANRHPRVNIHDPGPGVGGHCIPVDPWFMIGTTDETRLMRMAREINDSRPKRVADKILAAAGRLHEPTIAILGLAYKADTADLRNSPALSIIQQITGMKEILVVEPHLQRLPDCLHHRQDICLVSLDDALNRADIAVVLVSHTLFKQVDSSRYTDIEVIDTQAIWT